LKKVTPINLDLGGQVTPRKIPFPAL